MRVRVAYTSVVGDDYRAALCHTWGECGRLATRQEVRDHMEAVGASNDDDLMSEWEECPVCGPSRPAAEGTGE